MNVIIAGGGVAGLTAAAVLRKLPFVIQVKLIFVPRTLSCRTSVQEDYSTLQLIAEADETGRSCCNSMQ